MSFKSFWNTYIIPKRTKENPAPGAFTLIPGEKIDQLWDEYTGKAAIDQQNQWQMELAKYQAQVNEDFYNKYSSPSAMMRQYQEAGLNPNLVYGSAASGQSNVPSFQAPNINRNISGADKVNKALSMLSTVLGLKQMIYQTDAAREAAEQSSIKTLFDQVSLMRERGNLLIENSKFGFPLYWNVYLRHRKDRYGNQDFVSPGTQYGDFWTKYSRAYRSQLLNTAILPSLRNAADYGQFSDYLGNPVMDTYFGVPYMRSRNAHAALNYRLANELGNAGTYGKLALSFFGLLK
jgi:hypothetical protein